MIYLKEVQAAYCTVILWLGNALPLGRWRNSLQQEDIPFQHLKLSDSLSMVGVELTASWQSTRKQG